MRGWKPRTGCEDVSTPGPRVAARPPHARQNFVCRALDDAQLVVDTVDHVHELLTGVGREGDLGHGARQQRVALEERLRDERAVFAEDLDAIVDTVADVNEPFARRPHAVHGIAELP